MNPGSSASIATIAAVPGSTNKSYDGCALPPMAKISNSVCAAAISRSGENASSTITTRGPESTTIGASSRAVRRKFSGTLIAPSFSVARMT
jgi:hypothetical protein